MKSRFYCDIRGTFDGGEANRKILLMELVNNLINLDNSEEILFSFVSSDDINFINEYMQELAPFIKNTKIKFGNQYGAKKVFNNGNVTDCPIGKGFQIYYDLKDSDCKRVYYAEDSFSHRLTTSAIMQKKLPHISFTMFETKNGIDSLNNQLNLFINNNRNRKNIEK